MGVVQGKLMVAMGAVGISLSRPLGQLYMRNMRGAAEDITVNTIHPLPSGSHPSTMFLVFLLLCSYYQKEARAWVVSTPPLPSQTGEGEHRPEVLDDAVRREDYQHSASVLGTSLKASSWNASPQTVSVCSHPKQDDIQTHKLGSLSPSGSGFYSPPGFHVYTHSRGSLTTGQVPLRAKISIPISFCLCFPISPPPAYQPSSPLIFPENPKQASPPPGGPPGCPPVSSLCTRLDHNCYRNPWFPSLNLPLL